MRPKSVVGMFGVVALAVLLSASWAGAWQLGAGTGELTIVANVLTFKTSPSVYADYVSDGGGAGDGTATSYVAGSVHQSGDRAYGIDPDYTGMYVQAVAVGTQDPTIPTTASGGSTGDFGSGWTAK